MEFFVDGNGSLCVEWEQAFGARKRAWIQRMTDPEKDWAQTPERRYLNVVRVDRSTGNPAGNPTDFPIYSPLADRQILEAFVSSVARSPASSCPNDEIGIVCTPVQLGCTPDWHFRLTLFSSE